MTPMDWASKLINMARMEQRCPGASGVFSYGEKCALALIMNRSDILPAGYTFLDAVERIQGDPILEAAFIVNRDGWKE